jgi:hypothetical protein
MRITNDISISEVQARMGNATRIEAAAMADLLIESGYTDTSDIPADKWNSLCQQALADAWEPRDTRETFATCY